MRKVCQLLCFCLPLFTFLLSNIPLLVNKSKTCAMFFFFFICGISKDYHFYVFYILYLKSWATKTQKQRFSHEGFSIKCQSVV